MNEEQIGIVGWIVAIISVVWMVLSVVDTTEFELSKKPQSFPDWLPVESACKCSTCLFEAEENAAIYASAAPKEGPTGPPEEFWDDPDGWDAAYEKVRLWNQWQTSHLNECIRRNGFDGLEEAGGFQWEGEANYLADADTL